MSDTDITKKVRSSILKNPLISSVVVLSTAEDALKEVALEVPDFAITGTEFMHESMLRGMCFMFPTIVIGHNGSCAIDAFEHRACDFLLAPVNEARLDLAVRRVVTELGRRFSRRSQSLLLSDKGPERQARKRERKKLIIRETGRIRLINQGRIRYIKGAGNYVEIYLNNGCKIMHRATLLSIERSLDPDLFCRIHKSTLINVSLVEELRPRSKGDYCVRLEGGDDLVLSRNNRDKLDILMEQNGAMAP